MDGQPDHRRLIQEEFRRQQQQLAQQQLAQQQIAQQQMAQQNPPRPAEIPAAQMPRNRIPPAMDLLGIHNLLDNLCRTMNINPASLRGTQSLTHPPIAARPRRTEGPLDVSPEDTMQERLAKMMLRVMRRGFTDRFDRHMPTPQQVLKILEVLDDPNQGNVIVPAYTMRWLGNAAGLHLGADLTRRTPARYEPMSIRELVETTLYDYEGIRGEHFHLIHPQLRRLFECSGVPIDQINAAYQLNPEWTRPVPEIAIPLPYNQQRRQRPVRPKAINNQPVPKPKTPTFPLPVPGQERLTPNHIDLDQFRYSPPPLRDLPPEGHGINDPGAGADGEPRPAGATVAQPDSDDDLFPEEPEEPGNPPQRAD